jgi:hypothetical protein
MKKSSLGPLRQGQRLDSSETKPCSNKERKPPNQSSNTTKSSPCTYAIFPWAKAHSPWTNAAMQHGNAAKSKILLNMPRAVTPPTPHLTARGRLDCPKWPALHQTAQKLPEQIGTPSKHSQVSKHAQISPRCWQCMNQGKMRNVSTYSFSNIQNSSQGATQVQMSKLDTL